MAAARAADAARAAADATRTAADSSDSVETSNVRSAEGAVARTVTGDARALTAKLQKAADEKADLATKALAATMTAKSEQVGGHLDRVSDAYLVARKLFGDEHVLLTAVAYSGQHCSRSDAKTFWSGCGEATRTGVGAVIGVPLIGGGAGHGRVDWWPRFETRRAAEVYLEYQRTAGEWSTLLTRYGASLEVPPQQRRRNLLSAAQALKALLDEAVKPYADPDDGSIDETSDEWPIRFRRCVRELIDRLTNLGSAGATPEETELVESTLRGAAEELNGLWDAYKHLAFVEAPKGRHKYLFGPSLMIPIQDIATDWMYGAVLEVGVPKFRFTLVGGLRTTYDNEYVVGPTGWYLGIGVSGEFADDFFNWAAGAHKAATDVESAIRNGGSK